MSLRDQKIAADARKPYADEIMRLQNELAKRNAAILDLRATLKLLLRKMNNGGSDFEAWHRASAVDIGEVLSTARGALESTREFDV